MEPQVNREVEAAQKLLELHSEDVPPQLVTALEKDQRCLSRTFSAARTLAESAVQGMQSHLDAQRVRQIFQAYTKMSPVLLYRFETNYFFLGGGV